MVGPLLELGSQERRDGIKACLAAVPTQPKRCGLEILYEGMHTHRVNWLRERSRPRLESQKKKTSAVKDGEQRKAE